MNNMEKVCSVCGENYSKIFFTFRDALCEEENITIGKAFAVSGMISTSNCDAPTTVCSQCKNELNIAYKLIQKAIQTNAYIEQQLQLSCGFKSEKEYISDEVFTDVSSCPSSYTEICGNTANLKANKYYHKTDSDVCLERTKLNPSTLYIKEESLSCDESYDVSMHESSANIEHNSKCIVPASDEIRDDLAITNSVSQSIPSSNSLSIAKNESSLNGDSKNVTNPHRRKDHNLKVHEKCENKCDECGDSFATAAALKNHLNLHKMTTPYICEECGKIFKYISHFRTHLNYHNNIRPHKCEHCSKSFTQLSNLHTHLYTHNNMKPYKCEHCERSFYQSSHLRDHMNSHNASKCYKCEECGKSFKYPSSLRKHMINNHSIKPYKCPECEITFAQSSNLRKHLYNHHKIRHYKCEKCGKSFDRASHLRDHFNIHRKIKPYKCEECGKSFTRMTNLKKHMNIHSGIKPYKCDKCEKSYTQSTSLRRHLCIHNK